MKRIFNLTKMFIKKVFICLFFLNLGILAVPLITSQLVDTKNRELNMYIEDFEEEYNITVDYSVGLLTIPQSDTALGVCYMYGPAKSVMINPKWWEVATPLQRRLTVYHELAHCSLGKLHNSELKKDGCPKSMMHPQLLPNTCLTRYWNYYVEELKF